METSNSYLHPSLDYDRLTDLYDGDHDSAAMMFEMFLQEILPEFSELDQAVAQNNRTRTRELAHRFVPSLGMVGLTRLEHQLRAIEKQALQATDDAQISQQWRTFRAELDQMVPLVEAALNQYNASA